MYTWILCECTCWLTGGTYQLVIFVLGRSQNRKMFLTTQKAQNVNQTICGRFGSMENHSHVNDNQSTSKKTTVPRSSC